MAQVGSVTHIFASGLARRIRAAATRRLPEPPGAWIVHSRSASAESPPGAMVPPVAPAVGSVMLPKTVPEPPRVPVS